MRITQRAVALTSLQGLYTNLGAVTKLQQQLTSGKTISVPSDDPTGANTSISTRQALAGNAQFARNITDGKTLLGAADSALQNVLDLAQKARDLTVQALNGGSMDANARQAIATELTGLRESMLGQANQVVQGRPLFGGATTGRVAYDSSGTYVGVGDGTDPRTQVTRRVSDVEAIRTDVTGLEAFGPKGGDLFAIVSNIATHAVDPSGGTTALSGDLGDLDAALSRMSTVLADIGTRSARMDTADQVNSASQLSLKTQLSATEDIDLPKTVMELQMQQNGYQAALSATAKAIQPSLVDFLR